MNQEIQDKNSPPAIKRLCLSLTTRRRAKAMKDSTNLECERFAGPVDTTTLETAAKGIIPPKTEQSTQWVVSNFESWSVSRASHSSSAAVPPNILCTNDAELVCKWLCCYVLETRNKDGSRYPPSPKLTKRCTTSNYSVFVSTVVDITDPAKKFVGRIFHGLSTTSCGQ